MLRLLDSGAVRRRNRAARGACVGVSDVVLVVYVAIVCVVRACAVRVVRCHVTSTRRSRGERRVSAQMTAGGREVCVMFSDVVLVVWLCASFG